MSTSLKALAARRLAEIRAAKQGAEQTRNNRVPPVAVSGRPVEHAAQRSGRIVEHVPPRPSCCERYAWSTTPAEFLDGWRRLEVHLSLDDRGELVVEAPAAMWQDSDGDLLRQLSERREELVDLLRRRARLNFRIIPPGSAPKGISARLAFEQLESLRRWNERVYADAAARRGGKDGGAA